ncbi:MAG: LON peptidase substrate-binding domain-containing protein [Burkholderiales bacterium]|nr:LON peptidase substrate-binding domain-containing protein [Burkholderiales bacterium]
MFEARYMDMIGECMREQKPFGVCLIRSGREAGEAAVPEDIGCLAHITDWDMQDLGVLSLRTLGGQRFRIRDRSVGAQGLIRARVDLIAPEAAADIPEALGACIRLLELVIADKSAAVFAEPHRLGDASWVGYRLTEILPVPLAAKQRLLELGDSLGRLQILHRFLEQRGLIA